MEERWDVSAAGPDLSGDGDRDRRETRGVEEMGERASRQAAEAVRATKEKLSEAYERTAQAATRAYDEALDYARENPGMAALAAFGVGLGLGFWLGGSDRSRGYRGRILPAMAVAVADALHEVFDGD